MFSCDLLIWQVIWRWSETNISRQSPTFFMKWIDSFDYGGLQNGYLKNVFPFIFRYLVRVALDWIFGAAVASTISLPVRALAGVGTVGSAAKDSAKVAGWTRGAGVAGAVRQRCWDGIASNSQSSPHRTIRDRRYTHMGQTKGRSIRTAIW